MARGDTLEILETLDEPTPRSESPMLRALESLDEPPTLMQRLRRLVAPPQGPVEEPPLEDLSRLAPTERLVSPGPAVQPSDAAVLPGTPSQRAVARTTPGIPATDLLLASEGVGGTSQEVLRALAGGQPELALQTRIQAAERPPEIQAPRLAGREVPIPVEAERRLFAERFGIRPESLKPTGEAAQPLIGLTESATLGLLPHLRKLVGAPALPEPETVAGQVGRGAGHLAGFIKGPAGVIGGVTGRQVLEWLAPAATDATRRLLAKQVASSVANLTTANVLVQTGQVVSADSPEGAARTAVRAAVDGALLGAVFGGVPTAISGQNLWQTASRVGLGMAALDLATGQQVLDDRQIAQKVFDYGLNFFFLYRGIDARAQAIGMDLTRRRQAYQDFYGNLVERAKAAGQTPEQFLKVVFDTAHARSQGDPRTLEPELIRAAEESLGPLIPTQLEAGLARRGMEALPLVAPRPEAAPRTVEEVTRRLEEARAAGPVPPIPERAPTQAERAAERAGVEIPPRRVEEPGPEERFQPVEFAQRAQETLQRAEEASRRAEEAVQRVEALTERSLRPEPLQVPEEATAQELPSVPRAELPLAEPTPQGGQVTPKGGQLPTRLWIESGGQRYPVDSLEDASTRFRQVVQAANIGATETPVPRITDDAGNLVGYVAYNGKVFAGRPEDWKSGQTPLYEPPPTEQPPPTTFRAFVKSKGRRWPITAADPGYVALREEFDTLTKPRYEKRGATVVDVQTDQVVATKRNGAEAQLEANRLNRRPPPEEIAPPRPAFMRAKAPVVQEGQPMFRKLPTQTPAEWTSAARASLDRGIVIPGTSARAFDSANLMPEATLRQLANQPYVTRLASKISAGIADFHSVAPPEYPRAEFLGLDLAPEHMGVNVPARSLGKEQNQIAIGPLGHVRQLILDLRDGVMEPEMGQMRLAMYLRRTVAHELAHEVEREHTEGFYRRVDWIADQLETRGVLTVRAMIEAIGEDYGRVLDDYRNLERASLAAGRVAVPEPLERRLEGGTVVPAFRRGPPAGPEGGPERGARPRPSLPGGSAELRGPLPRPEVAGRRPEEPGPLLDAFGRPIERGPAKPAEPAPVQTAVEPTQTPFRKPPEAVPPTPPPPATEPPPPLVEPVLTKGRFRQVVDAAEEVFTKGGVPRDKELYPILSDQIQDLIRLGRISTPDLVSVLSKHDLTLTDFGDFLFRPAIGGSGQKMQMLSALSRRLNKMALEVSTAEQARALVSLSERIKDLEREAGDADTDLKAMAWWRRADNVRRGLLVAQLATSVRNFETQVGRLGLDVLDQALQRTFGSRTADPWAAWEAFTQTLSQARPTPGGKAARRESSAKIDALLEAFPKEWDRLFGSYSSDIARSARDEGVTLSGANETLTSAERMVHLLNFFNRFQEFAVRRSVFWADLSSRLDRLGMNAEELVRGTRKLSAEEWDRVEPEVKGAVQKALELTFAQTPPYDTLAYHLVRAVNQLPLVLTGPIPFPRFMYNALKFQYEFSPLPFLTGRAFTQAERAKWAAGDRQTLSRATLGTALLLASWLAREMQPDENKWYEVSVPGTGLTDIRPFNPFASYFFLGEVAKRARTNTLYRIDSGDLIRGIASANVRGGLGLFALDKIVQGLGQLAKPQQWADAVKGAGGELLSGLLVPLRTLTDLYAQFDPEWQVVRERRAEPLLGPVKAQFGVGEPQYLPTRAEPQKRREPLLRQTTGITKVAEKNALEVELDRFQFNRGEVQGPSLGDPEADNLLAKYMGQLAEEHLVPYVQSAAYQNLSDAERMHVLRQRLSLLRVRAKAGATRENPDLFQAIKEERRPARERLFRQERQQREEAVR